MTAGTELGMKKELSKKTVSLGWILLAVGALIITVGYLTDSHHSVFSNVIGFLFLSSLGLGSLFLIGIEYLTGAVWSVPTRRVNEFVSSVIPVAAIVAAPMFLYLGDLFHWVHTDAIQSDALLVAKSPYLNVSFFIIRFLVIFFVTTVFYFLFTRNSLKQDTTRDQRLTTVNTRLSAALMPVLAVTATILSIDWGMSLEPHWYSTMYGVYYLSGTILAALASTTLIVVLLFEKGFLPKLTRDHFYGFGAMIFAFVNFWAYIAFSQFMLIWYANLPEETGWFNARWQHGWQVASVILIIVHFAVPYFVLLSQDAKMDPKRLKIMAIWLLIAHYFDLYWLVMPTYSEHFIINWRELGYPLAFVGLIIIIFSIKMKRHNLVPVGDPKLERGLEFKI